jgi:hydroxymethylglutaryl-CoA lyase
VRIVEVGPRDGLQNEPNTVPPDAKVALIEALARAGLKTIEAGSFVSAKWVPQMADTADVLARLDLQSDIDYPVLVPNLQGLDRALKAGVREVAVFGSASESFSQRNINCSIEESFDRFTPVIEKARGPGHNISPARSRTRLEGRARARRTRERPPVSEAPGPSSERSPMQPIARRFA